MKTSKYDRLQVEAFQMLFRLRRPEVGIEEAFTSAIADTSDENLREALLKHPPTDLV